MGTSAEARRALPRKVPLRLPRSLTSILRSVQRTETCRRDTAGSCRIMAHAGSVPTSTSARASVFRPELVVAGRDTKVLIDQIRTIDVSYVTGEMVDYLTRDDMALVEHGLSRYVGLLR